MTDIWDSLGSDIPSTAQEWLYRYHGEVRGPIPFDLLVTRLENGEISLEAEVAREGGDFYPLAQVRALESHLPKARRAHQKRAGRKIRRVVALLGFFVLTGGGTAGFMIWQDVEAKRAKVAEEDATHRAALAAKQKALETLPQMQLVAIVSLGTEKDVKIRSGPKKARGDSPRGGGEEASEKSVSSCTLTQQDIFGTLRTHLAKINVCVQDEKKRDTQGLLPPQLALDFVVTPDGKVVDFAIPDRHFRAGPMNNCMIKVFRGIRFPTSTGSNCPVTIPIKIGG